MTFDQLFCFPPFLSNMTKFSFNPTLLCGSQGETPRVKNINWSYGYHGNANTMYLGEVYLMDTDQPTHCRPHNFSSYMASTQLLCLFDVSSGNWYVFVWGGAPAFCSCGLEGTFYIPLNKTEFIALDTPSFPLLDWSDFVCCFLGHD